MKVWLIKNLNFNFSKLLSIALVLFAALLFGLANPNIINATGFSFLAFIYFVPVFIAIFNNSYKFNYILGFIYGFFSYAIYGYWLKTYGVFVKIFLFSCYGFFWGCLFIILNFVITHFKKYSYIVLLFVIISFEYLKTKGFFGFGYGITGYTQWQNLSLIQIADVFGVFGVSAIVIFPSCLIFEFYKRYKNHSCIGKDLFISTILWIIILILSFIYGKTKISKIQNCKIQENVSVALIQNNEDPFGNGFEHYRNSIQKLITLTNYALENHNDIDIVVWPETAVVPSFNHYYAEENSNRKMMITALVNYFQSKNCNFVIGNAFSTGSKNYNSALFFKNKQNIVPPRPEVYSKTKLVPFSEYLPFGVKSQFLENKFNFHFWDKGENVLVFEDKTFSFGTPICFEDTFDYVCRKMNRLGADFFVNVINDSWGKSLVCQNQHLAMGVFRAVENKIPSVRCASTGQTCYVSAYGKVENLIEPFAESYGYYKVPVYEVKETTVFSVIGNFFSVLILIICLILLLNKSIFVIMNKVGK